MSSARTWCGGRRCAAVPRPSICWNACGPTSPTSPRPSASPSVRRSLGEDGRTLADRGGAETVACPRPITLRNRSKTLTLRTFLFGVGGSVAVEVLRLVKLFQSDQKLPNPHHSRPLLDCAFPAGPAWRRLRVAYDVRSDILAVQIGASAPLLLEQLARTPPRAQSDGKAIFFTDFPSYDRTGLPRAKARLFLIGVDNALPTSP